MQVLQIFFVAWFALSVLVEVIGNLAFYLWLRSRGLPVRPLWAGMPGYLDDLYIQWCRAEGRPRGRIVLLRRLSLVNLILAGVIAIPGIRIITSS